MMEIGIRGVRILDPLRETEKTADILISGGRIAAIGELPEDFGGRVLDGAGLTAAPGFVDVHVHFRDPGLTYKEDILTGAEAAAAGGYTTVICMANTKPVVDNPETLSFVLEKGRQTGVHVLSCACVTKDMAGKELTDMEGLREAGAAGFTDDGKPILDAELLKAAFAEAARLDVPVSLHEEDPALIADNGINRGEVSEKLGIGGSPAQAEVSMVERDCRLAEETGARVNIQHISTAGAVEAVRRSKQRGSHVTAEAAPHHFTLTEDAVLEYGTLAKMNPPLRTREDRLAVIEGLRDGTIDLIATDHAPHSAEEKARPLTEAPSGIIGLETSLSLGIMNLVHTGKLTMEQLLACMTVNPAALYGLDAGRIYEGGPADLILFDENEEWVPEKFFSKSQNSPFLAKKLTGKVKYTVCRGRVIYEDNAE